MDTSFAKIFTSVCRAQKELTRGHEMLRVICEEYDDLSRRLERSAIQESFGVRSHLRARRLAMLLIDEKGELDQAKLKRAIERLKQHRYFLGPGRLNDSLAQNQLLKGLEHLASSVSTQKLLKQFSRPLSHPGAERVIRETLDLAEHEIVTDVHTRQAVLSAWLSFLRQSVGSCFATAPAILLQAEQPDNFLLDLKELLETGRMKRVSGGIEYHAPLSYSSGVGDLRKPLLIESGNEIAMREKGYSPGLMAALMAAGVVEGEAPLKERVETTRDLVEKALKKLDVGGLYFVTTAEKILQTLLLEHFNIDEKILQDWERRPREMVFGDLMLHMPHASRSQKGIGEACSEYLGALEAAKSAFKRLAENTLLKVWEFTLASFSETKADFTRWNLYASLGMDAAEPNGIGAALYSGVSSRLEKANQKVEEYQREYESLYSQLKYAEGRMRGATTEKEIQWLKVEYQSRLNEFQTFEAMRDREHYRAKRLASLFSGLIDKYLEMFPRYFQEVYDADVHSVPTGFWDDRPAGFRLLFKHGRMNTAQWSRIDTPHEFSDALASFFSLSESEISYAPEFEGMEHDISDMITLVIHQVKTKEFLESALWRMAKQHHEPLLKDPLENIDKIEKKPWAYTSGGNLQTLISCYFNLKDKPKEASRYVDNEMELLVFIADAIKAMPAKLSEQMKGEKRVLMHSPTHAFNLMPGLEPFSSIWQNQAFTFTWVRDELVFPMQSYWAGYEVHEARFEALIDRLALKVPLNFQPRFRALFHSFPGTMSPSDLASFIAQKVEIDLGMQSGGISVLSKEEVDICFYAHLPLLSRSELLEKGQEILKKLPGYRKEWLEALDFNSSLYSPHEVIDHLSAIVISQLNGTSFSVDYAALIVAQMRHLKLLPPSPILFADTNWPMYFFAFLVSPASGRLELWRTDRLALTGAPMSDWKPWLNGEHRDPKWGLLTLPYEYHLTRMEGLR